KRRAQPGGERAAPGAPFGAVRNGAPLDNRPHSAHLCAPAVAVEFGKGLARHDHAGKGTFAVERTALQLPCLPEPAPDPGGVDLPFMDDAQDGVENVAAIEDQPVARPKRP